MATPNSWPAEASIKLVHVEFDGIQDFVDWGTADARDLYFGSAQSLGFWENVNQLQPGAGIVIPLPYADAVKANYLVMMCPDYKLFYFVDSWTELSPAACMAQLRFDFWTSGFGSFYVRSGRLIRSTVLLGNEAEFTPDNVAEYWNESEGLSNGQMLRVVDQQYRDFNLNGWNAILVTASCDIMAEWGTESNMKIQTSKMGCVQGTITPQTYIFDFENFKAFSNELQNAPWIAQCLMNIVMVPSVCMPETLKNYIDYRYHPNGHEWSVSLVPESFTPDILSSEITNYDWYTAAKDYYSRVFGQGFPVLNKIFTAPYTYIQMRDAGGNGFVELEPQLIPYIDSSNVLKLYGYSCVVAGCTLAAYFPKGYNAGTLDGLTDKYAKYKDGTGKNQYRLLPYGEGLGKALYFSDFPSAILPVDNAKLYRASTFNSYQNALTQIQESRMIADKSAEQGYQDTMYALQTGQEVFNITNVNKWDDIIRQGASAQADLTDMRATGNDIGLWAIGQAVGRIADTGLWSALSMLDDATNANKYKTDTINQINLTHDTTQAGINRDFSLWANGMSEQMSIDALEAGRADAQHVAPGTVGAPGGVWSSATGQVGIQFSLRMPDKATMQKIVLYWLAYGYADDRDIKGTDFDNGVIGTHVGTKWDFWQFANVNVDADGCPQEWADLAEGALMRGIKIWSNPDDVGKYTAKDNRPNGSLTIPARI